MATDGIWLRSKSLLPGIVGAILLSALLISCAPAHFSRGQIPPVKNLPAAGPIPSVALLLKKEVASWREGLIIGPLAATTIEVQLEFKEIVKQVAEQSGLFNRFTINPKDVHLTNANYSIEMDLETFQRQRGMGLYAAFVFSSLGAIPLVTTTSFALTAHLRDRRGETLKTYLIEDSKLTVIHTLLVPVAWWLPDVETVASGIVENMVRSLLQQMLDDRLLM